MIEINLHEEKKSINTQLVEYLKYLNWKLTIFAIIFFKIPEISVGIYFKNEMGNLQEEKERVQKLVDKNEQYVRKNKEVKEQVKTFKDKIVELEVKIEQIKKISEKKINPFSPLENIIHIIPESIWLTELMVKNSSQIKIKGMSREYKFINNFKLNLNKSPFFENSFILDEVQTVNKDKKSDVLRDEAFALTGKIVRFEL